MEIKLLKKKLLGVLLTATMVMTGLTGCGTNMVADTDTKNATDKNEQTTIHLAVQKAIPIPYLADAFGYFDDEFADDNIKVELDEFSLGPAIVEAVGGNQVDIGFLGDLPAFSGLTNGGDYKIIGRWESGTDRCLIVRDDANIKSLDDLKGKKLAVAFGSSQQTLVYLYLESVGLTDSDVELINLSIADSITGIVNGDVDAAVVDETQAAQAMEKGGITKLTDSKGYKLFVSPIIAPNSFLEENPEITARVLKVLQKTAVWSEENNDEAIKLSAERIGVDEATVGAKLSHSNLETKLGEEETEALQASADQCYELGILKSRLNVKDYIDTSYLEMAEIQ